MSFMPAGHFYSPEPDLEDVRAREASIWNITKDSAGIDTNLQEQLDFLERFKALYSSIPFPEVKTEGFRYFHNNGAYDYTDAIILHSMIRTVKPKNIIEVGSGFSSCVTLDTNDLFFGGSIKTKFIEPYPTTFNALVKEEDKEYLVQSKLQNIPLDFFDVLEENDILFIDSSHVSKAGSDVNYVLFEILPRLKEGVYIHFHDVFAGWEYPKDWVYAGRVWTESYLLRAFLQYNSSFKLVFFSHYMEHFYAQEFEKHMPLCMKCLGGSFWLRKVIS